MDNPAFRARTSWRPLSLLGFLLLAVLLVWVSVALSRGALAFPQRDVLLPGFAFSGDTALPAAEIQKAFVSARERMLEINRSGYHWKVAAHVASWLSFLASSVIAVLAGYYGHLVAPTELKADQLRELLKQRSKRYIHAMGILAAAAAILTGIGNRAASESSDSFKAADEAQRLIAQLSEKMEAAKTATQARPILDELQTKVMR